jgi:tetratricopeptide (TPR) repeat protein
VLVAEDGSLVRVIAAPQAVLVITHCTAHGTPFDLTRAAYHLGNRHVPIELKPDHHHAYNALGYSLAERNQRLPEALGLIKKALDLAPGEPFITDSLGWVEYRMGNRDEALRLLQQAYRSRPDVEIGAHLGEVLWINGQRDEARRVLRDARSKDNANDVLKETLARLRVDL